MRLAILKAQATLLLCQRSNLFKFGIWPLHNEIAAAKIDRARFTIDREPITLVDCAALEFRAMTANIEAKP